MGEYCMERKWELKHNNRKFFFEDQFGNKSEDFYYAWDYHNGFALVTDSLEGDFYFRDMDGNLSEGFSRVLRGYGDEGFAIVQKYDSDDFYFRDKNGNLYASEEQFMIESQKEKSNKEQIEDAQQSTSNQSKSNEYASIEDYFKNEVLAYDLSPKDIYNNLDKIVDWEKYNCKLEMENSDEKNFTEIFERYSAVAEYIKYVACEYNKEIKKEESIEEYTKNLF